MVAACIPQGQRPTIRCVNINSKPSGTASSQLPRSLSPWSRRRRNAGPPAPAPRPTGGPQGIRDSRGPTLAAADTGSPRHTHTRMYTHVHTHVHTPQSRRSPATARGSPAAGQVSPSSSSALKRRHDSSHAAARRGGVTAERWRRGGKGSAQEGRILLTPPEESRQGSGLPRSSEEWGRESPSPLPGLQLVGLQDGGVACPPPPLVPL